MLYILAAMQKEADALLAKAEIRKEFAQFGKKLWEGEAHGVPFTLLLTGVGKTNAAAGAMLAIARGADRLLNIGVAGGIAPRAPYRAEEMEQQCGNPQRRCCCHYGL